MTAHNTSLDAKSKVTDLGATAGQTAAAALKAAFVTTSGKLSGSFTHPALGKAVSFEGRVFQKTHTAAGYFLYSPPAAPAQSGAVGVATK